MRRTSLVLLVRSQTVARYRLVLLVVCGCRLSTRPKVVCLRILVKLRLRLMIFCRLRIRRQISRCSWRFFILTVRLRWVYKSRRLLIFGAVIRWSWCTRSPFRFTRVKLPVVRLVNMKVVRHWLLRLLKTAVRGRKVLLTSV